MGNYQSFTINSATPAVDLMSRLNTEMVAGGWDYIETYTNGATVVDVFKAPAEVNDLGLDFFIGLKRTSTASAVYVIVAEQWDTANKKFIHYNPSYAQGASGAPDSSYRLNESDGQLPTANTFNTNVSLLVAVSVARTYRINIDPNRFIWGVAELTNSVGYAGLFDSFLGSTIDPVPLVALNFSGSSSNNPSQSCGSTTREPGQTNSANFNFCVQMGTTGTPSATQSAHALYPSSGVSGMILSNDHYRGNVAARIWFASSRAWSISGCVPRGILRDVLFAYPGATASDTITLGGNSYVLPFTPGSNYKFFMPTF